MSMYLKFDLCVQDVMYAMLAALYQFNFCFLLRFIIISSVHGAFLLSTNMYEETLEFKNSNQFSYWNRKGVQKAPVLGQKTF